MAFEKRDFPSERGTVDTYDFALRNTQMAPKKNNINSVNLNGGLTYAEAQYEEKEGNPDEESSDPTHQYDPQQ